MPSYLLGLVAAVVIPLLVSTGYLLIQYAATERRNIEEEAARIARQVSLVIDGELTALVGLLRGLASSASLEEGDFAQFHSEAKRAVSGRDELIVLRDFESRQIVNTQLPFGAELPPAVPIAERPRTALMEGRPWISDVYASPISKEPRIAVALQVLQAPGVPLVLAVTVPTTRIRDAMKPAVPAGWIVGVGDVSGTYITRSARHDDVSGKPAVAEYIAKAKDRSGAFTSVNFEGLNLLAGYQWSDLSGWLVGANIRQDIVEQPLRRMLTTLGLLTAASLALSVLLAYTFSQPLLRSINGLASRAAALGKGQPVSELNGRLAEFELVSATIVSAAQSIEEQARQKNLLIAELNHRVKNTLAIVQSLASNTLRGPELAPLKEAFSERLQALAAAHDLLTRESWEGAQLHEIISAVLGPQAGRRFTISGPDVRLDPSQAVRLTMLLHELATNAVKYGALSNDSGRISITSRHGSDELCLCWVESGGPAVTAPNRQGFGSRLLGMATGGFSSSTSYAADGLICKISIKLTDEPT